MRKSEAVGLIESLGFDPLKVSKVVLTEDELQVTEKGATPNTGVAHFFDYSNEVPLATFFDIEDNLRAEAPTEIFENFQSIQIDFRGISARVQSGLVWQWPWQPEVDEAEVFDV